MSDAFESHPMCRCQPLPIGYDPGMARSTVDRVGETILVVVADDRGNRHDLLFSLDEAEKLGRALILKTRTEGHDALDDLIERARK